ncbi:MAG: alpha/beta hydrolase family protein [Dehalococcoidia bacterium]
MTSSKGPADSNGHLNDSSKSNDEIREDDLVINFKGVSAEPREDGTVEIVMETNRGNTPAILHPCEGQDGVVMFIGGGSDLKGPAGGIYENLAKELAEKGVTSMRVGQRKPDIFVECVGDTLAAISFLKGIGAARIALVGHSSNGAVAIKSANFSNLVTSVASLAGQTFGAQDVSEIAPRNLLVIHGKSDQVLPYSDAQRIYDWAKEPKELVIYEKAGHGLNEIKEDLYEKLIGWIIEQVGPREQLPGR